MGTLTLTSSGAFGLGGQLIQLRDAITDRGEKIPGRTSEESLEMVNGMIAVLLEGFKDMSRERMFKTLMWCATGACMALPVIMLMNFGTFASWLAATAGAK